MHPNRKLPHQDKVNKWLNKTTPTAEELKRRLTEEQIKQLCLAVPAQVDLTLFNPVFEIEQQLDYNDELPSHGKPRLNAIHESYMEKRHQIPTFNETEIRDIRGSNWALNKMQIMRKLDEKSKACKEEGAPAPAADD